MYPEHGVERARMHAIHTTPRSHSQWADAGMIDCAKKAVVREGSLTVLWRGFTPAFIKLAPFSIISLTLLEKMTALYTGGRVSAL